MKSPDNDPLQARMGGRIGTRMERALKKEEIGIAAMNNQTVRQEDDSPGVDDEDLNDDDFFKDSV